MRSAIGLAVAAAVLASCAAGAGDQPGSATNDQIVLRAASTVQVLDSKGQLLHSFGRAIASPDGSVYYSLASGSAPTLEWIDGKTGRTITRLGVPGQFAFADEGGPAPTGLSPNGRWLVLVGPSGSTSSFAVIDTSLLKVAAVAEVPGAFTYDAISDDGSSLYLTERIGEETARNLGLNASYSYRVRVYDVPTAKLSDTLVLDVKLASQTTENNAATRLDGIMNGIYQSSVPSRDGRWNFSFYYNPARGPFIHALHLNARNAFCILDLPIVAGGYEKRLAWSLALAPSGTTLYATNGALGMASAIDASTLKVTRTATIAGLPAGTAATPKAPTRSAVSPDGRKLYFPANQGVALVDTLDFALRGHFLADRVVTSLSLSADGRRLYAMSSDGTVWMLNAMTGRQLAEIPTAGAKALVGVQSR
jgi:YVTN family beta-propeller protein